ncbi:MAG TPA: DUF4149 domain-containing protein [Nitrospirota bacterium]|nr:DUF4149 domain-containing protein [Nitrospirota bacterium]
MKLTWFLLYDLILSLWVGGIAIFTFIVTPSIFKSFGRDEAGAIVGKLFPGYFSYVLVLSVLAFIVFFAVSGGTSDSTSRLSFFLLIAALVINIYVSLKLYPDAVKLKREITSFERESPDSPARKRFTRLHAVSAVLNLAVLADGVILLLLGPALKK